MRLACVTSLRRGDVDLVLHRFSEQLLTRGVAVEGLVQINSDCGPDKPCDMDARVLPVGPVFRISQALGAGSAGCRLDPSALERAVGLVGARLSAETQLLIINKFGKQEAEGRGFREVIAEALVRDIPVVVGLSTLNRPAFEAFAGDLALPLAPDLDALMAWFDGMGAVA